MSLRLGALRGQVEQRAAELEMPVRRYIRDAVAEKLARGNRPVDTLHAGGYRAGMTTNAATPDGRESAALAEENTGTTEQRAAAIARRAQDAVDQAQRRTACVAVDERDAGSLNGGGEYVV